jgi:ribonucleoside-diphosphate reductase alpha chain
MVGDSQEGWSDAIKVLVESYFYGKITPVFDFRDIRDKGAELVTSGGKAPGAAPLRDCLERIRGVFDAAMKARGRGCKLSPLEVHDVQCHIADAVLVGGIRRAALICLFDYADEDMLTCKSGAWWEDNPHRGRANNSVMLKRGEVSEETFFDIWQKVEDSGAGEPGIIWTNSYDYGTNP